MRPVKLIIQAFGPFADTEVIQFDQLGRNPLFLINGPTGAGKSSILDAICFALYGQTTGKEREANQMRCDHASIDLLTEITLDVALADNVYRIRRSPVQERPKARGEGSTTHQTEAQLWQLKTEADELLVAKSATEATRQIETLTGLNVEQFRQVMVLPQGKFREFLMADSSQREAIFSQLFQTQIYKRLEDALKIKASGIRREVESLQQQIKGILLSADVLTEKEVTEQIVEFSPQLIEAAEQKKRADDCLASTESNLEKATMLQKAFIALAATQKKMADLNTGCTAVEASRAQLNRARSAQKIEPHRTTRTRLDDAKKQHQSIVNSGEITLKQQQANLRLANENHDKELLKQPALDLLKTQRADLQKLTPKIEQLSLATAQKQKNEKILARVQAELSHHQAQLKTHLDTQKHAESRLTELKHRLVTLPEKQRLLEILHQLSKQRAQLDTLELERASLSKQQDSRQQLLQSAIDTVNKQDIHVKTLELAWHSNQAQLLAAELKQDTPCPVCGSKDHPSPAIGQANNDSLTKTVSKEDVELARERLSSQQKTQALAQNQLTETETKQQSADKQIVAQRQELGDHQHKPTEQLRFEYKQLDTEIKTLLKDLQEQTHIEATLQSLSTQRLTLDKQLDESRNQQQLAEREASLAAQAERHIEQELPEDYRQPGRLQQVITQADTKIAAITKGYEFAREALNKASIESNKAEATLEQQRQRLQALEKEYSAAEAQWQAALHESAFTEEADFLSALLPEPAQQQLHDRIQQHEDLLTGTQATLTHQQAQLADQQTPDMTALKDQREQAKIAAEQVFNHWQKLNNRQQQLINVQNKLDEAHRSNAALEADYQIYGTLSDVANGQTGNKISLQRFVLSVLLDDVLIEASHRFSIMSCGRYLLVRKEDRAKGNKASGLELEVEDAYTGKTRSVATLSGGESFMAALSLALGLSDVVQAYAGGIRLDTLFIDEGFGSLDQESLDLAIKTLIDLQSSGRMIGIISHVSELREQMALRIEVERSSTGSKIRLSQ